MTEQAAARRMRLLEELQNGGAGRELIEYAGRLHVDERTIRRDVDYLQDVVATVRGIEVRRGHVYSTCDGFTPGYFTGELQHNRVAKEAIARRVVESLGENLAIVITAGTSTYFVAREIKRATVEEVRPHNLIAFTNSLPALMALISGGVSTGIIGEVYNPDDCAFHSHELRTAFHPGVAIVGASGVVANPGSGTLDLYSHRAEEASFMKQLLGPIPEIIVAVDGTKVGKRHPWSFTSGGLLTGKSVRLFTDSLDSGQTDLLESLAGAAHKSGSRFGFEQVLS